FAGQGFTYSVKDKKKKKAALQQPVAGTQLVQQAAPAPQTPVTPVTTTTPVMSQAPVSQDHGDSYNNEQSDSRVLNNMYAAHDALAEHGAQESATAPVIKNTKKTKKLARRALAHYDQAHTDHERAQQELKRQEAVERAEEQKRQAHAQQQAEREQAQREQEQADRQYEVDRAHARMERSMNVQGVEQPAVESAVVQAPADGVSADTLAWHQHVRQEHVSADAREALAQEQQENVKIARQHVKEFNQECRQLDAAEQNRNMFLAQEAQRESAVKILAHERKARQERMQVQIENARSDQALAQVSYEAPSSSVMQSTYTPRTWWQRVKQCGFNSLQTMYKNPGKTFLALAGIYAAYRGICYMWPAAPVKKMNKKKKLKKKKLRRKSNSDIFFCAV
ncbi:MAG TPA: hypothetical protein VLG71_01000, partial [Candidatus Limnocylindria bacterium]|nr:hypothetical protein [Candidatus Limnocylindria bacterium]